MIIKKGLFLKKTSLPQSAYASVLYLLMRVVSYSVFLWQNIFKKLGLSLKSCIRLKIVPTILKKTSFLIIENILKIAILYNILYKQVRLKFVAQSRPNRWTEFNESCPIG